ncbi:MAG TPA: rhodanese-like domain-containing protein [Chitinophagaceae bacterium]|jgi:rhodanese-related sulfurtransferase|nr:rhodanese-like domain-containing protein [Chitinophagaceae bacterium]
MFGLFGKNKIKEAIKSGAVIIDVRTPHEYDNGKVPGSINIPVDRISASIERIRSMKKPVVFCCESGMRSTTAKNILKSAGLQEVYNGGSWESVLKLINKS